MEQVRNAKLDRLCESIGEQRAIANRARLVEKSDQSAAVQVMQRDRVTIYQHAGVELVLVPGVDKLRVHLKEEQGDMQVGEGASENTMQTGDSEEFAEARREALEDLGAEG